MKTLIVTGAGASAPYGFPTGDALRKAIITSFVSDYKTDTYISSQIRAASVAENFCEIFQNSETNSIDLFLSRRKEQEDFQSIGKSAIAYYILKGEIENNLHTHKGKWVDDDWYSYLYNRLTRNSFSPDEAKEQLKQLSVVTFNYDRSLEYFFSRAYYYSFIERNLNYIGNPDYSKVPKIEVRHIYGSLGEYRPESYPIGDDRYTVNQLMTSSINIIYDQRQKDQVTTERVQMSEQILFLGVGYLEDNLRKLGLFDVDLKKKTIRGTGLGMHTAQVDDVKALFPSGTDIEIIDCDCTTLLRMFYKV